MRRRLKWLAVIVVVAGALTGGYLYTQSTGSAPKYRTATVTKGELTSAVSATGNLNAVITVQVGSQVSGQIRELYADFNSQVKKTQLIARIAPETFEAKVNQSKAEVESAEAAVLNARAGVERARADIDNAKAALAAARAQTAKSDVALVDARRDLGRKQDLFGRELIALSERDTAQVAHDSALAQVEASRAQEQAVASTIRSAEAQLRVTDAMLTAAQANVRQKRAALQQAQVDLENTFIRAPVDGVVVSRNVDTGQTVAASLQAPTLFTIAQDLTKMQVDTNVDEADVGKLQVDQRATFTVDSFPGETFRGQVVQIRKAPRTLQNVVTYNVVVATQNPDQKLLPGMTANVRFIVQVKPDVLRVPNAALRFRPPGEEPPRQAAAAPGSNPLQRPAGPTMEEIRERLVKELSLTDEQQKKLEPILEESRTQFMGLARVPQNQRRAAATRIREETRQKVRAILTPEQQAKYDQLPQGQPARAGAEGLPGRVFVLDETGKPKAIALRLGISDGQSTEVLSGELKDGQEVITSAGGAGGGQRANTPGSSTPRARF